ncbi:mucin-5AC-like [Pseudonaja textilis]|nr:mucin-5AC-like [Pseudonaja textilis]
MGIGRGTRIPLWIPILMIILSHQKVHAQFGYQQSQYEDQQSQYEDQKSQYVDQQSQYEDQQSQYVDEQPFHSEEQQVQQTHDYFTTLAPLSPVSMIPALRTTMVIKSGNSAHNHRVCSTWGNFHFKTFDGDIYQFPGLCNYVFASHCKSSYEDFNVQIRHLVIKNVTVISHVVLKLDGVAVELTTNSIIVNGEPVQLPYSHLGILMERISDYLKIQGKSGITLMWNHGDSLLLELNEKYANQTCGLCGDFNQIATYNEFISNNVQLTPLQFGNMQKMDGPTEQCEDPVPLPGTQCSQATTLCQNILTGNAFEACNALVDVHDYIDACKQDICQCNPSVTEVCICNTFAEYSRQCSHAGGQPLEWRTEDFCPKSCPFNMQHRECGSPCFDTCTNFEQSQLCEDHCIDGCFCPPGTVFDDINNSGCIPSSDCYCTYNGDSYAPGTSFSSQCISCSCTGGQWTCISLSCPGVCSVEGGSHITSFDEKHYSFFGDCSYMLTKLCDSNTFAVLGEIQKCGMTETETCLKGLAISTDGGQTVIVIKSNGAVYVNMILTQLPISASNVTIFNPTSFFTVVDTKFGFQLVVQFIPTMQLFIYMDPSHKGQTCGLCGNFNGIQTDDFKAISGVTEGTPAAFANTWKTQADCPNIKNIFENPCTLSIENEKYALHWCGLLTDTKGPFQKCHSVVNPDIYHTNCMFDTCNCEKSEDCMCAALSAYVRACAAKGVLLSGWRTIVCAKFQICPETWSYHYNIGTCQATCRALSEVDVTCKIKFPPVDGCTCEEGTYLDDSGKCVPASKCPCYHKGSAIPSGQVVHDNGIMCTCVQGKLQCIGVVKPQTDCVAPMVYFDCNNSTANTHGAECQKSCQTLDMGCYSAQCVSGCVCPDQLVSDGTGKCIPAEECPCVHNEATYKPGETIKDKCNTCTCKNRKWICSNKPCLETCSVYGDGHYITFDDKRYSFNGLCEYTLVQNQCSKNKTNVETFRVITENIPCGSTGTTCSKAIKVFAGKYELLLTDGKFEVIQRLPGGDKVPFKIRYMGIYMVIEIFNGSVILIWDKKTSVFIKLEAHFKGEVCGLCGNYDGNDINDFTTRSQSVIGDVLEFGNSWKVSPTCPDASGSRDPCTANPYRSSWAQRQCSIIHSKTFALCHPQIKISTLPVSTTRPIVTMTPEVITTTVPQSTSSIASSTTTIGSSTSHCFCQIGENIYMPGEIIYKQTDSDGCLYFAICGSTCSVERYKGPCVSTTPKPTSTPTITSTTPTTSTAGTTPPPGCPDAIPPREVGETWIENCTKATCIKNNSIMISKVECPPVQTIVCENGYPPVKVFSKDGCCYHYECECICSGWGDPHFVTFDGVYYTFLDHCTYVLVQQIIPKYDNFKILLGNYYCDTEDQLSCPQSIIIHYKSSVIVLTREHFNGIEINKIYFNGKLITTSFQKDGIYIYTIGINMVVEISEMETVVTYSGTIFSIKLPFSKFYNNTEGQCGTCTNNIKDECRLPNGKVTDCPHMAPHWKVPDPKKDYCVGTTPPVPTEIITPAPEICSTAPLCSLILNEIFSECHKIIPPDPYFQGCLFDACHMKNISMQCSGLEIYASLCASKGVCIDWRGKTNDECSFSCPTDKVYVPCGPINPPTCDNSGPPQTGITEGCFCKNGTKLFSTHRDICVSDCGCTGPDGLPKVPGETWISNCQKCTCEEYSLMVQCIEEPCPTKATPVECSFEGFVPMTILTPEEKCCPQKQCVCNTSHCPRSSDTCPLGYELKKENLPGGCCINTTCVKVPGCVVNGTFYSPGAVIPAGLCESCICSEKGDPENNVECVFQTCDQRCPLGHKYQKVSGQCCGRCVQFACVLTLDSYPAQVLKPGETWYPPGNNCTAYECNLFENQYIPVSIKRECPPFDPNCRPEDVQFTDDGCCKWCKPQPLKLCGTMNITKTIKHNGCESSPIEVTYCKGQCDSFSMYSYKANTMNHTCHCCQEQKTTKKQVTLICADGSTLEYSYLHVDECDCIKSECNHLPTSTPVPQEEFTFLLQEQQQQLEQQQQKKKQQE